MGELAAVRDVVEGDSDTLMHLIGDHDRVLVRIAAALNNNEDMLVAEVDGVLRGTLSVRWTGGCDGDLPWLYGAEVEEGYRNQSLGTALWEAAEIRCRQRGAKFARLDVEVTNIGARRLYECLGYVVVGPHRHHWRAVDPVRRNFDSRMGFGHLGDAKGALS